MYTKKVTIVIPIYNGEKYIEETVNSCLNQTYCNIKIVTIDDNSTDNTIKILKSYDSKIELIANKINQGLPKNINSVILNDDSDFFIYLGHDDILPMNHVELMLKEFDDDIVAVHCNSMSIDGEGKELQFTRDNDMQMSKTEDAMYQLSIDNFISVIGMMNRTKSFQAINGWDDNYGLYGEWLYYIRLANVGKLKYTDKSYAYYRIHETNITKTLHSKDKLKAYYNYKSRCRKLAHTYSQVTFLKKINYYFQYFLNYLRYIKALIKVYK